MLHGNVVKKRLPREVIVIVIANNCLHCVEYVSVHLSPCSQLYWLFIYASKYIFPYKKILIDTHTKIGTEITDTGRNY